MNTGHGRLQLCCGLMRARNKPYVHSTQDRLMACAIEYSELIAFGRCLSRR